MESIYIASSIMALKRTPAEKMLLARICEQSVLRAGSCTDTNKELAASLGMHHQTVSDLVNRLSEATILRVDEAEGRRTLTPLAEFLTDYSPNVDPPKSITYTPLSYSLNPLSQSLTPLLDRLPIERKERFCPVTGVDISDQPVFSKYVTAPTLERLARQDKTRFDELVKKLLTPSQANEPLHLRCSHLAKTIRKIAKKGSV